MSMPGIMGSPELSEGESCLRRGLWPSESGLVGMGNVERRRTVGLHRAATTALTSLSMSPFWNTLHVQFKQIVLKH